MSLQTDDEQEFLKNAIPTESEFFVLYADSSSWEEFCLVASTRDGFVPDWRSMFWWLNFKLSEPDKYNKLMGMLGFFSLVFWLTWPMISLILKSTGISSFSIIGIVVVCFGFILSIGSLLVPAFISYKVGILEEHVRLRRKYMNANA